MSPELDKKLCEKYPVIFRDRHGNKMTTAMCWGFDHGDGWYHLLDSLCHTIQSHIDSNQEHIHWCYQNGAEPPEEIPQVVAVQVKEKYATLRFYYNGGDSHIDGAVHAIETLSRYVCEECGKPGEVRNDGWLRTLCDDHYVNHHPV